MNNIQIDANVYFDYRHTKLTVYVLSDNASLAFNSFNAYMTNTRAGSRYRKMYYSHYDFLNPTEWNMKNIGTAEVTLHTI